MTPRTPVAARLPRRFLSLALAVAGGACAIAAAPSAAVAQQAPIRIAVVNPSKVFADMEERKALQSRNDEEQKRIETQGKEKAAAIQKLQKERDDAFAPNSPQHEDATAELARLTAEYKVWAETERLRAEYAQKKQTRQLFDRIQLAVGEIAKRDGIDLVIADSSERLPENVEGMNVKDVRAMILQKDVLFVGNRSGLDITDTVILKVNAAYKAGGGNAGAPAAKPAPAAPGASGR